MMIAARNAVISKISLALLTGGMLAACSSSESDNGGASPPPPSSNNAPVFSSATSVNIAEGTSGAFYTATATDADGDSLSFSIAGGDDQNDFSITQNGALSFAATPDFDAPADADGNNIYLVTLQVSDGAATATLDLEVTVTESTASFSVRRVIASGLNQPLYVLGRGDGTNRIFILEKTGGIEVLDLDTGLLQPTPFLDVSSTISTNSERGLLGMALAPDFATSGVFYIHVSNVAGDTEIRRYEVSGTDPNVADPSTMDVILTASQPASNHNGGWIDFGPDGFLYIALGDGGGANDEFNQAQDFGTLLGSILRIDPSSDDFPSDDLRDYAIPAGNPFTNSIGLDEIYAYGLRNPFRCAFDRVTGVLYIGDVGQGAIEEVDIIPPGEAGLNFGWPILEGTQPLQGGSTVGLTPPVAEYVHGFGDREGNSITGGMVYRGAAGPLQGRYVFGDFVTANIWSIPTDDITQGTTIPAAEFTIENTAFTPDSGVIEAIVNFGEDDNGNLYVVDITGEVFAVEPM